MTSNVLDAALKDAMFTVFAYFGMATMISLIIWAFRVQLMFLFGKVVWFVKGISRIMIYFFLFALYKPLGEKYLAGLKR